MVVVLLNCRVPPAFAKPPGRCKQAGDTCVVENDVRKRNGCNNGQHGKTCKAVRAGQKHIIEPMKKYFFFLCVYISTSTASASLFCMHQINVNNNFSISIEFQDILKTKVTTELYFDLLVWAKNVEKELANINGSVYIDYLRDYKSIKMWISKTDTAETAYRFFYDVEKKGVKTIKYTNVNTGYTRDFIIVEEYFLDGTKDLTKAIIARLNVDFKTNGHYGNLNSVELFVKNKRKNEAKDSHNSTVYSDYIYINREELMKNIKEEKDGDYFIETIRINRRKVNKIVHVDSSGCG